MGKKILIFIGVVLFGGIIFIYWQSKEIKNLDSSSQNQSQTKSPPTENEKPQILEIKPKDGSIISSDEEIEITFNRGLENEGELKIRIEPKVEYKITLMQDRKVARVTPLKPFELGSEYTLYITGDTKFTGHGAWGEEKTFRFRTIKYRGI